MDLKERNVSRIKTVKKCFVIYGQQSTTNRENISPINLSWNAPLTATSPLESSTSTSPTPSLVPASPSSSSSISSLSSNRGFKVNSTSLSSCDIPLPKAIKNNSKCQQHIIKYQKESKKKFIKVKSGKHKSQRNYKQLLIQKSPSRPIFSRQRSCGTLLMPKSPQKLMLKSLPKRSNDDLRTKILKEKIAAALLKLDETDDDDEEEDDGTESMDKKESNLVKGKLLKLIKVQRPKAKICKQPIRKKTVVGEDYPKEYKDDDDDDDEDEEDHKIKLLEDFIKIMKTKWKRTKIARIAQSDEISKIQQTPILNRRSFPALIIPVNSTTNCRCNCKCFKETSLISPNVQFLSNQAPIIATLPIYLNNDFQYEPLELIEDHYNPTKVEQIKRNRGILYHWKKYHPNDVFRRR